MHTSRWFWWARGASWRRAVRGVLWVTALSAGCARGPGVPSDPSDGSGGFGAWMPNAGVGGWPGTGGTSLPMAGAGGVGMGGAGANGGTGDAGGVTPVDAGHGTDAETSLADAGQLPRPLDRVQLGADALGAYATQRAGSRVRFIAVGDTGTGDALQQQVADAMVRKCEQDGCDFVLLLGDNIYEGGPLAVDDVQWQSKFETPYALLDLPFYAVLGNHDVGLLLGAGYNPTLPPIEVEYTMRSEKWKMPAPHYTLSVGDLGIVLFDSTALYNHVVQLGDQHQWIDGAREELLADHRWVFAAAHHTYVSNGEHGNAGSYAYLDFDLGHEVKTFVEDNLCGQVDALFTGHDHNRQWLDASLCGGTEVIVSGAGAKVRDLIGQNPVHYQANTLGFFYGVVDGDTFTGQMLDETGEVNFERVLRK